MLSCSVDVSITPQPHHLELGGAGGENKALFSLMALIFFDQFLMEWMAWLPAVLKEECTCFQSERSTCFIFSKHLLKREYVCVCVQWWWSPPVDDFNTLLTTPACSCRDMWDVYFPLQDRPDQSTEVGGNPQMDDTSEFSTK